MNASLGIMPGYITTLEEWGVISRSGTLTYEAVYQTDPTLAWTDHRIGIGGDPVNAQCFVDALRLFESRRGYGGSVMIGEDRGALLKRKQLSRFAPG